jgi:ATP phosphoribosyltransferase
MKLKLGLPKGSLQEATFALFERAGFNIRVSSRSYQPVVDDETIEPILLRPQEIPLYLQQGVIDAGLTGADWVADTGADLHEVCELRYSKLTTNPIRVVLAVHQDSPFQSVKDLQGKRIATEYVRLTERYLATNETEAKVDFSWGACEVKVPTLVDAIVVNTETGNSLKAHNLRIIETLLTSTTRFVANHEAMADEWKRERIESLEILLTGAMNAAKLVGLKMNLPCAQQAQILGEREVRDLIPALKRAGATGLVEYPLNKVIY